jgi:hypothetical protein
MGQRNSIYEYNNVSQDLEKLRSISKQYEQLSDKMALNFPNVLNNSKFLLYYYFFTIMSLYMYNAFKPINIHLYTNLCFLI